MQSRIPLKQDTNIGSSICSPYLWSKVIYLQKCQDPTHQPQLTMIHSTLHLQLQTNLSSPHQLSMLITLNPRNSRFVRWQVGYSQDSICRRPSYLYWILTEKHWNHSNVTDWNSVDSEWSALIVDDAANESLVGDAAFNESSLTEVEELNLDISVNRWSGQHWLLMKRWMNRR